MEEDGVEVPWRESKVEDDWAVGTVPLEFLDDLESLDDLSLLPLFFFRRKSLKNGMFTRQREAMYVTGSLVRLTTRLSTFACTA